MTSSHFSGLLLRTVIQCLLVISNVEPSIPFLDPEGLRQISERTTTLEQHLNRYFDLTQQLECSFRYHTCGWKQETVINPKHSWQYSYTDMALIIYNTYKSVTENTTMPRLASPVITDDLSDYCFSFDYRAENSQVHVESKSFSINGHSTEDEQLLSTVNGNGRAFIQLPSGTSYRIMLEPNITESSTNFFIELKRFKVFNQIDCAKAKFDYRTKLSKSIIQANGSVTMLKLNIQECAWIDFNGTFQRTPDIIVTSETKNVRVTIDYKTVVGFEMCAFAKTYLTPDQGARLSWRANENVTVTCDKVQEYRCQSGECIERRLICNAKADCLSGDDETSLTCAQAMSQLAFATFATTVMVTYLITYMKYIKDIRQMINGDRINEENRLEQINLRELRREESANDTIDQ
jgi:hypothetical protein